MPAGASANLFSISTSSPGEARAHGAALAYGRARAGFTLHRGIDAQVSFEAQAHADADVRDAIAGGIAGGVDVGAGLGLRLAFPLDLFEEAGVVARLQAEAEAAAYVQAQLGLELAPLRELVRARFEGPMRELCDIFLEEAALEAGVWARAAFAAELLAEATLTGSLVPSQDGRAGFSFSVQYAAGVGFGSGVTFLANIGFQDPRRLLDRLSDRLASLVLAEADRYVDGLSGAARDEAARALAFLRLLLPLAGRAAFELGAELAATPEAAHAATAARRIIGGFIDQARGLLLQQVLDLAVARLTAVLGEPSLVDAFQALDSHQQEQALQQLVAVRDALVTLDGLAPAEGARWLTAILALLEPAEALTELGIVQGTQRQDWEDGLAWLWAAGVVLRRVLEWAAGDPGQAGALFGPQPVPTLDNSLIAARVATAINKRPGSALTLADLVEFLVGADLLQPLRQLDPATAHVIDVLEQTLAALPGADLVRRLLADLSSLDEEPARKLLEAMSKQFTEVVRDEVGPKLLTPLKAGRPADDPLVALLDTVVGPTLVALPAVVLKQIPGLGSEQAGRRFREALSAILLQSMGHYLTATIDVLLERGLELGQGAVRDAGQAVRDLQHQAPAFALLASAAVGAFLPVMLTPEDAAGLLDLAAEVMERFNADHRQQLMSALDAVTSLAVAGAGLEQALSTLIGTDDPPNQSQLDALLSRVERCAWELAGLIVPEALKLLGLHFLNEVKLIAEAIFEGAKAVVAAVEAAAAWVAQELAALQAKLKQLVTAAAALVAGLAGTVDQLAGHLLTLEDQIIDSIRDFGWTLGKELVSWAPGFARDAAHDAYNALFEAAAWVLEAPLRVLQSIAGWVHEELTLQVQAGHVDRASLDAAVRDRVHRAAAQDVKLDLSVDLGLLGHFRFGTVTIPAGTILGTIGGLVTGDQVYGGHIDELVGKAGQLRSNQGERAVTQHRIDQDLDGQKSQAGLASVVTGQPLSIRSSLADGSVHQQRALLQLNVDGANPTFVEAPMGLPRRVKLLINGQEYPYSPDQWTADAQGVRFSAYLVPRAKELAPQLLSPAYTFGTLKLPPGATITATAGQVAGSYQLSAAPAQPLQPAQPPRVLAPAPPPQPFPVPAPPQPPQVRRGLALPELMGSVMPAGSGTPSTAILGSDQVLPLPSAGEPAVTVGSNGDDQVVVARRQPMAKAATALEQGQGWQWTITGETPDVVDPRLPVIVGRGGLNVVQVAVTDGKSEVQHHSTTFFLQ
jgi:hypothetical protein